MGRTCQGALAEKKLSIDTEGNGGEEDVLEERWFMHPSEHQPPHQDGTGYI